MNDLIFRRAKEDEIPQIIALQTEVFSGEQDIPEEMIDSFLSSRPTCWVAEQDGRIVGTISAWEEEEEVHLGRFAVLPALRGQKIGSALLHHAVEDLFRHGTAAIHVEARDSAAKLVRRMGGRDTGEPFPFYRGTVTPMVLEKEAYRNLPIFTHQSAGNHTHRE